MNTNFVKKYLLLLCILPFLFSSCNTMATFLKKQRQVQLIDPQFPYMEENLTVIAERSNNDIAMAGRFVGGMAKKPQIAVESIIDGYTGRSSDDPYGRGKPYYFDEYRRNMLGDIGKELMEPVDSSVMNYPPALRSPFITEGVDLNLSTEAVLYQRQLDELAVLITQAEGDLSEGSFISALAAINQVLDRDPTNDRARILYGEIVRAEERSRYEKEVEVEKAKITEEQRVAQKEQDRITNEKRRQVVEAHIARIEMALQVGDTEEAERLAELLQRIAPDDQRAIEAVDEVDLTLFKQSLDPRIIRNEILMEDVILEYFKRYQEYRDAGLDIEARRELKKIAFLESLRQ